jgi:hypothetical protein
VNVTKGFWFCISFYWQTDCLFQSYCFWAAVIITIFSKKCLNDKHWLKNNVFLGFRNSNCFYHATFTQKHSKEQYHPLHKRVIILYLYRDNIKTDFNQMNDNLNEKSIQNTLHKYASVRIHDFSLHHGIIRPTKIIKRSNKNWAHF